MRRDRGLGRLAIGLGFEGHRAGSGRNIALVMPQAAQNCGAAQAMRCSSAWALSKHASIWKLF